MLDDLIYLLPTEFFNTSKECRTSSPFLFSYISHPIEGICWFRLGNLPRYKTLYYWILCLHWRFFHYWKSKKQSTESRSSVEVKYRSMANATCKLVWFINLWKYLKIGHAQLALLFCDNQAALHIVATIQKISHKENQQKKKKFQRS